MLFCFIFFCSVPDLMHFLLFTINPFRHACVEALYLYMKVPKHELCLTIEGQGNKDMNAQEGEPTLNYN